MKNIIFILFAALLCVACNHNSGTIIGVKIYEYQGDYGVLARQWTSMGINTAFVSTNLAANDTFRTSLKKNNIKVFVIFPVFQNPEALQGNSSLAAITDGGNRAKDDWVEFVCPSRETYRRSKISELSRLVRELNPDGISLDFIRQFVFWEMIYPDRDPESIDRACYCDSCLAKFMEQQGVILPDSCRTTRQKADYVSGIYEVQWNAFRCDLITTMVKELAEAARNENPGIKINVHAVPWRADDFNAANIRVAAQDLRNIAYYADYISPMCYSQMLKRDAGWISDVVAGMDKQAPGMVLPSIQVYPYYIDSQFTAEDFRLCIQEALKPPSRGVVFWSWPLLVKEVSRMEAVEEVVKSEK